MHPLAIVPELRAGITDEERAEWLASDPRDWANESVVIARKPEVGYCVMVDGTCQYAADNREFAGRTMILRQWTNACSRN